MPDQALKRSRNVHPIFEAFSIKFDTGKEMQLLNLLTKSHGIFPPFSDLQSTCHLCIHVASSILVPSGTQMLEDAWCFPPCALKYVQSNSFFPSQSVFNMLHHDSYLSGMSAAKIPSIFASRIAAFPSSRS